MKKLLSALITFSLIFSMAAEVYAVDYGEELKNQPTKTYTQTFSDVPESFWAFSYIAEMVERGILDGYPDGKFYPNSQVTRAEFAKIMTMAAGVEIEEPTKKLFSDVPIEAWYTPYVHAAQSYLSAYNQNGSLYYKPNTPALREDIAVALVKLKGYSVLGVDLTTLSRMFSDYKSISEDAQKYVAAAVENELISGYEDGTFRGQRGITRAEAATLLWRAYQFGDANKSYDTSYAVASTVSTANPTETPQVTPTAKPTAKPTPTAKSTTTVKNTVTAAPTAAVVEVAERKKPYVMKKLASANVGDIKKMTFDGDDSLFYIDSSDNAVYRISVSSGNKSKYMTTSKFKLEKTEEQEQEVEEEITETVIDEETGEETEVTTTVVKTVTEENVVSEYSSYVPSQVFYDNVNDKLLLIGYYENVAEKYSTPKSGQTYMVIYDITDGEENLYSDIGDKTWYANYLSSKVFTFQTAMNEAKAIITYHYTSFINSSTHPYATYSLDVKSGKLSDIGMGGDDLSYLKYGSDIYSYDSKEWYPTNSICKYNFNNNSYDKIAKNISFSSLGTKNDCYYFWNGDGSIYKISMKTGKSTTLDINTSAEDTEFEDMGNMNGILNRFVVVDEDTMVFYDTNMSAFRILMKND